MTTHTTSTDRTQLITGLRQLADYLDTHPAIPVTGYGWDLHNFTTREGSDQAGRAEVDHVADLLGREVCDNTADGGHYTAARAFGPVTYEFIHIPATRRAQFDAWHSYSGAITPDNPAQEAR
jgi:hypothetical protein